VGSLGGGNVHEERAEMAYQRSVDTWRALAYWTFLWAPCGMKRCMKNVRKSPIEDPWTKCGF